MRRLWSVEAIRRLLDLGFSRTECEAALSRSEGDVEDAIVDLLAEGPSPVAEDGGERKGLSQALSRYFSALKVRGVRSWKPESSIESGNPPPRPGGTPLCVGGQPPNFYTTPEKLASLQLKSKRETTSISLCIIDDCLDADVPLADLKLSNFFFEWNLGGHRVGQTRFTFATDYFNRRLSAWEPLVEPWK